MDDEKITELLYGRNEDGLTELEKKYGNLLKEISDNILRDHDDADECLNDVLLKVWNMIPPYRPVYLRSFICRLAKQISIDAYRKKHRIKRDISESVSLDEIGEDTAAAEDDLNGNELAEAIESFVSGLGAEDRVYFIRRYFMFESVKSLSGRFGRNPDYISTRLFRTKSRLLKYLKKRGIYDEKV